MGININLKVGYDEDTANINASGTIIEPINNQNKIAFGLTDKVISDYIDKYRKPKMFFNLFKTDNVITTLEVKDAEIITITSEPIIVKTQSFVNNSSSTGTFNVAISDSVSNTMSNNWSTGGTLSIGQKISYGLGFIGKGETSISYSQSWGIGGSSSVQTTVGSSSGVSVTLNPQESVVAQLSASKGTLKANVNYNAFVSGYIEYIDSFPSPIYNGVYRIDVNEILNALGLKNSIESSEVIEAGYYSSSEIILSDNTGKQLSTHYF